MCNKIRLCDLALGQKAVICSVDKENGLREALARIGIIPGTTVLPALSSPLGGSRAYLFSSVMLALRDEDTCRIRVLRDHEME